MSMFAATTCSSVRSPAARRENRLARGSTAGSARRRRRRGGSTADPVADRRECRPGGGVMAQPARDAGEPLPRLGHDAVDVGVLEADPSGHEARTRRPPAAPLPADPSPSAAHAVSASSLLCTARRPATATESRSAPPPSPRSRREAPCTADDRRPRSRLASAVFSRIRRTSATLHACATHPRGIYGGSASKISLIDPTHASIEVRLEAVEQRAARRRGRRDAASARRPRTARSASPRPCPDDRRRRATAGRRSTSPCSPGGRGPASAGRPASAAARAPPPAPAAQRAAVQHRMVERDRENLVRPARRIVAVARRRRRRRDSRPPRTRTAR